MEKKYFVLFLRHEWGKYGATDYLAGVFSSHEKASTEGCKLVAADPDFYCRFYITPCDLDKTI